MGNLAPVSGLCSYNIALGCLMALPGWASLPTGLHDATHGGKHESKWRRLSLCALSSSEERRPGRGPVRPLFYRAPRTLTAERALYLARLCASRPGKARHKRTRAGTFWFRFRHTCDTSAGLVTRACSGRDRFHFFRFAAWPSRSRNRSPLLSSCPSCSPLKLPASSR